MSAPRFEELLIDCPEDKAIYFASDFHLGAPNTETSLIREKKVINWLQEASKDAHSIFLVGDVFDFWFEYKRVIPKGFVRFQYELLRLKEKGINVYLFVGNHDIWMFDYFPSQFNIPVFKEPIIIKTKLHKLLIGHGDGLGPGDHFYKFLKKVFHSRLAQRLFKWIHPDIGVSLAQAWSKNSRASNVEKDDGFESKEKEWLWHYSKEIEESQHHDYYVFGHRHIPLNLPVSENATYINTGEWIQYDTYARYDKEGLKLLTYPD